jgi:hypothetical protein
VSADTAKNLWALLAFIGGSASTVGLGFSVYGLRIALRRWIVQGKIERYVVKRDIFMLGAFVTGSAILVGVSVTLIWLSRHYPHDLDPVLKEMAVPVFFCYLGFAGSVALFSTAGPIWVVSRLLALVDLHLQEASRLVEKRSDLLTPKAEGWHRYDAPVVTVHRRGMVMAAYVTYWARTASSEVLIRALSLSGVVTQVGDLLVHVGAPPFLWLVQVDVEVDGLLYSSQIYGTERVPLKAGKALDFIVTLPQ